MPILAYLSPAKSMRLGPSLGYEQSCPATEPRLLAKSAKLAQAMRAYDAEGLRALMEISSKLAELNAARFLSVDQELSELDPQCRRAAFLFDGDAYEALSPESMDRGQLARLQAQIRLLSGYYGLLRPMDLMRAYRLEMGRRPQGVDAKSLYEFWGSSISDLLASDAEEIQATCAVSLASEEYDKAARAQWSAPIPLHATRFESHAPTGRKVVSFDAKRARGLFARHLCSADHSGMEAASLAFISEGWTLDEAGKPDASGAREWVFHRPHRA